MRRRQQCGVCARFFWQGDAESLTESFQRHARGCAATRELVGAKLRSHFPDAEVGAVSLKLSEVEDGEIVPAAPDVAALIRGEPFWRRPFAWGAYLLGLALVQLGALARRVRGLA